MPLIGAVMLEQIPEVIQLTMGQVGVIRKSLRARAQRSASRGWKTRTVEVLATKVRAAE